MLSLAACSSNQKDSAESKKGRKWLSMEVAASAYTARPEETKAVNHDIAAWGDKLVPGMKCIAVSRDLIPLGLGHNTPVKIEGLPGEYLVKDKMNKRWEKKIDIFFGQDVKAAKEWGKRTVTISWPKPEKKEGS
jgi:3D (Asp-Asp-Asp) domain-containing protein